MNQLAVRGPIADTMDQIFEPIRFKTLADLFVEYKADREKMVSISHLFDASNIEVVRHFLRANAYDSSAVSPEALFRLEPAIKALNATYWQKALSLTDVLEAMPQKRRDEWHNQIQGLDTPDFDETTVLSTLQNLLAMRHKFFAERVDGIFQSLSHEHVTNQPQGFSKRMILNYVYNGGFPNVSQCGVINDLRCVIAKFMGREGPRSWTTLRAVERARQQNCGQWVPLDGGTLRIRLYLKGTAHLEVHPEMAWRLNSVLASLYPTAIPEEHRTRRKQRAPKNFTLYNRPLPFPVIEILINGRQYDKVFTFHYSDRSELAFKEACAVLVTLGGVPCNEGFRFDYDFKEVLSEVIMSGMIPDQRAHQFYPTPEPIAELAVSLAGIEEGHSVLEPSAGHGNLAVLLPKDRTTLVEVAPLNCSVLKAKGFTDVISGDFLQWKPGRRFDRIVMNPPFTKSQWVDHVEHAATLLAAGGRLVAVLPNGATGRNILPGWKCTWTDTMPFPGTSIEVTILVAERD